jgi:hypothetical protein
MLPDLASHCSLARGWFRVTDEKESCWAPPENLRVSGFRCLGGLQLALQSTRPFNLILANDSPRSSAQTAKFKIQSNLVAATFLGSMWIMNFRSSRGHLHQNSSLEPNPGFRCMAMAGLPGVAPRILSWLNRTIRMSLKSWIVS